ncbi:MAG: CoA transferase [Acidiferrobacteraceae bacterium]|jgi:crotonobetainyl-CoA:carnitine CoA-transferase CaiB-like acyl-CoA transferase|nr:CoA transferase [Acidiferrobacteraceae bacterium]MBT3768306.1 CoA transferase [Acidiferrobacteraceae bacterium]MBT3972180.1 CoA transferase [Acidiferrobacteraceae bacterium]MBT4405534.1 CoA transferase [Acidiferrobacteraceae bacterium]MBT5345280.1 CoA transferase [Acidiferrobacteraceae bacterium]
MTGPLTGYRIVELTSMLTGPWAASMLGDQGADVIKVEVPGVGDHTRAVGVQRHGLSSNFLNINRSKRSITINLKSTQGRAVLEKLASNADVLIQNFRPGVVERLGVSYSEISTVAPNIIYVSMSGFSERGPLAKKPVYDPIIQAISGLATVQAGSDQERPRLIRTILPDKVTAIYAAQAVTAALLARERTGKGQHVRLSMLDAVLNFLWASDMGGQTYVDQPVSNQAAASFIDLIYETQDGYMTVSTMTNKEWEALSRAFERPDLLEDARFKTPQLRGHNVNDRLGVVQEVLLSKTTREWLDIFDQEDVPSAPALTRDEVIKHPQVIASDILREHDHPIAGRLRQARVAARFEGTPPSEPRGAPQLGEHSDEVLIELGFSDEEISALKASGAVGNESYPA